MVSIEMYEELFKDDKLEDLYQLYHRIDQEVEKKKGQRIALVFLGYFAACVFITITLVKPSGFGALLGCLLVSAIISSTLFWVNISVFNWLFAKNDEDNKRREHIEIRIRLAQKRQQREP